MSQATDRQTIACLGVALAILASLIVAPVSASAETLAELRGRADSVVREQLGKHTDRLLIEDARLGTVARWTASEGLFGRADAAAVRERLWAEGVLDFEFLPLVVATEEGDVVDQLIPLLQDRGVAWERFNSVAVGAARRGEQTSLAVVLSRRAASFTVAGGDGPRVRLPTGYDAPVVFATRPDGAVERRDLVAYGDGWLVQAHAPMEGRWLFELLAEGASGPEVLALWPTVVGAIEGVEVRPTRTPPSATEPFPDDGPVAWSPYQGADPTDQPSDSAGWISGRSTGPDRAPTPDDARAAEDRLWAMIAATRRSRGLISLRRHAGITRAARRQARELATGPFAHHTESGTALDRLSAEGLTAARATENIARASDVSQAHAALMASPAHRANLLDPRVSTGGVGVVLTRDPTGRWSAVVSEVFATLLDADGEGADWQSALAHRLNDRRTARGMKLLVVRETFGGYARGAAEDVVASGEPRLSTERRKELAEEVRFHFLNARDVGIDMVVTAEPATVDLVEHTLDPRFTELGVGIVRLPEPMGEHSVGTLVIVLLFVER